MAEAAFGVEPHGLTIGGGIFFPVRNKFVVGIASECRDIFLTHCKAATWSLKPRQLLSSNVESMPAKFMKSKTFSR